MSRITFAILLFFCVIGGAFAAQPVPFTASAFAAAQALGKPILVDVTAPWCPVCAKQHPILSQLEQTPEFRDLVVFDVDFDSQKDILKQFGVRTQSTLIVFAGKTEVIRVIGVTDPAELHALLMKSKAA